MVDRSGIRPHSNLPVLYADCRPLAAMIMNSYELRLRSIVLMRASFGLQTPDQKRGRGNCHDNYGVFQLANPLTANMFFTAMTMLKVTRSSPESALGQQAFGIEYKRPREGVLPFL